MRATSRDVGVPQRLPLVAPPLQIEDEVDALGVPCGLARVRVPLRVEGDRGRGLRLGVAPMDSRAAGTPQPTDETVRGDVLSPATSLERGLGGLGVSLQVALAQTVPP